MGDNDLIKGFPLDKLGIVVDLNVFTDPSGQLMIEAIPTPEDEEKFGIEKIMLESELVFHDIFQEVVNQAKRGGSLVSQIYKATNKK